MIYQGRANQWRKLANSLMARYYTRLNKVNTFEAGFEIDVTGGLKKIFGNPADYPMFESNEDDAQLMYTGSQPYVHPFYSNRYLDNREDFAVSKNLVDLLQIKDANDNISFIDKRLYVYAKPTPQSMDEEENIPVEYVGQINGATAPPALATISRIGNIFRDQPAGKSFWMTYSELQFIKAEAALNGITDVGGSPQFFIEEGITSSFMKQFSEASAYQAPIVPVNGHEIKTVAEDAAEVIARLDYSKEGGIIRVIMEQKYISIFSNGIEGYAELRRTGWPAIDVVEGGRKWPGKGLPNRFPYPISESRTNSANYNKAVNDLNIEQGNLIYGGKMWFTNNTDINYKN